MNAGKPAPSRTPNCHPERIAAVDLSSVIRGQLGDFGGIMGEARDRIEDPEKILYRPVEVVFAPGPRPRSPRGNRAPFALRAAQPARRAASVQFQQPLRVARQHLLPVPGFEAKLVDQREAALLQRI